jgi:non-specific serine/threonine protein kinase
LEAAEAVAGGAGDLGVDAFAGVEALAEQSLVHPLGAVAPGGSSRGYPEPRFGMLETVREYGLERLVASGEEQATRRAHAAYFLAFAERAEPTLPTPAAPPEHLGEHGNVREALGWFERGGDAQAVLRLAGALLNYWYAAGRWTEGRGWLERALSEGAAVADAVRAKGLLAVGLLAHYQGDPRAIPWLEEGLALFRTVGDAPRTAFAQFALGVAAEDQGDYARARAHLAEAAGVHRALGNRDQWAWCLMHLGIVAFGEGGLDTAESLGEEARALARELGDAELSRGTAHHLAHVACARGDHARAAAWFREELRGDPTSAWSGGTEWRALSAAGVATLAAAFGEAERAARLFGAAEAARVEVGLALALPERAVYERAAEAAKARLGDEAFAVARAAGREAGAAGALADIEAVLTAAAAKPSAQEPRTQAATGLTPREMEVLRLLAAGRSDKEIAAALYLSPRTVQRHVAGILDALDLPSRAAAAAYAVRHGLADEA